MSRVRLNRLGFWTLVNVAIILVAVPTHWILTGELAMWGKVALGLAVGSLASVAAGWWRARR